jgi:hypothetical protein
VTKCESHFTKLATCQHPKGPPGRLGGFLFGGLLGQPAKTLIEPIHGRIICVEIVYWQDLRGSINGSGKTRTVITLDDSQCIDIGSQLGNFPPQFGDNFIAQPHYFVSILLYLVF